MGLKKVQKQGRDDNTRRLSCCRKVMVKKDWKATLLLLSDFVILESPVYHSSVNSPLPRQAHLWEGKIQKFSMSSGLRFALSTIMTKCLDFLTNEECAWKSFKGSCNASCTHCVVDTGIDGSSIMWIIWYHGIVLASSTQFKLSLCHLACGVGYYLATHLAAW